MYSRSVFLQRSTPLWRGAQMGKKGNIRFHVSYTESDKNVKGGNRKIFFRKKKIQKKKFTLKKSMKKSEIFEKKKNFEILFVDFHF